ncbi:MAG: VCBS repeat-containing protein [Nitrospirae bacterium]|nr:VCBS repeat-containing protein [Nitrospirota bacterium]
MMHKPPENTGLLCMMLLAIGLLIGCTSGGKGGTGGTVTIQSSPFPELAEMTSKVNAYLEIAGKSCILTVDPDTTLSGQCPDIPMTANSYNLKYVHTETGLTLAEAGGTVNFEGGQNIVISVPSLTKDFDDDGDGYTNIGEMIFGSDPESLSSYPFERPAYYYTGEGPNSLALGDLNGDGVLDVVTADRSSDSMSVLLGKKDGTFQTAKMYTMGSSGIDIHHPEEVTMGDMNGDNRLDVVVISSGANSDSPGDLAVFLGNGDGTLQSPIFHTIGNQPISVALGDINLDGNMDAVTANYSSGDVAVLLGNGDGSFQPPIIYHTNEVSSIALGDLNGDNILDMVASVFYSQTVVVLLGNGDGTFQSSNTYGIGLFRVCV